MSSVDHGRATKFILKVRGEDVERVGTIFRDSVLPELVVRGYSDVPVVVAKTREIGRTDERKAKVALEELSYEILEVSQSQDAALEGDLASLRFGLINGVWSHAHGMIHHHKKNKRPREYELLRRELYEEKSREIVAGVHLDVYISHSGGGSTLPSVMAILSEELKPSLFLDPKTIEYTVFGRSLTDEGKYALQTFIAAPSGKRGDDPRDVKARVRSLIEDVAKQPGSDGTFVLKSTREGRVRAVRCYPNGIRHHRGDEPTLEKDETMGFPDIYEMLTFWRSDEQRNAAKDWLERKLPEVIGDVEEGYGGFACEIGDPIAPTAFGFDK